MVGGPKIVEGSEDFLKINNLCIGKIKVMYISMTYFHIFFHMKV